MESNFIHLPLYRLPVTHRLFRAVDGTQKRWLYCHWLARVFPKLGEDIIVLARKRAEAPKPSAGETHIKPVAAQQQHAKTPAHQAAGAAAR